ncbi:PAS domain-containing protein [Nostoc parmelioides]|uniref:histidine kinase n=1 Tax=Nostoc parmelioides FACHB-3921 TaxID=2692909 RepID=A0ABR8BEV1_9NOSO|nr:PAS domain-containing protein [Nostoc parmelioides]MBD2252411.1 PAS domain-containing protein [Nostoc parmelioides FACHB-3921]
MSWQLVKNSRRPLVIVVQDTPLVEAIAQMYQAQTSCVLVINKQQLLGIFTQTDVLRGIAHQMTFADMTVGELMSQPVITVNEADMENLPNILQRFHQHQIRHLPVLDDQGQVLCVVTLEEVKTAQLEQEVVQREQMSELLSQRDAQYQISETRLNDILNSAIGTAIVSFRVFPNGDWEYDYQSVGCETIFGYTAEELLVSKEFWLSRVHPHDVETVIMPGFADIFAGKTFSIEYRFYHKDGSLRWIGATHSSRYDPKANCWVVIGTNIDISERKQAEAALRKSEERWQLAIAGTEEAIWDWDILTNHTYRSDRWFEMLGYERHEMSSFDDEWSIRIHPNDYDRVMAAQAAYLRREVPVYYIEYRLRRKDGNYKWFRSRGKAVWNEQGNPIRLVGSLGDITERKSIEADLISSEAQYRLLFENNPNPMWIFDPETLRFLAVNQAAIYKYGYSEAEFLSITVLDIRPREEVPAFFRSLKDFDVFSSAIYVGEAKHCTRNGTLIDVEINSHLITWLGKPAKFVLAKDITEQKAAQGELQRIEAELRESKHFIEQVISHSPQLLYIFDPIAGSNVYLNRQSVDILGYTPEEIQQRGAQFFLDVLHPDDLPLLERNLEYWQNAADGEVLTTECRMKHQDGSWRWLRSREVVFARDENNRPTKVLGTTQDISDSKLAELEIVHSRDLLEAIYNGSTDALFLVNPQTLLIIDCNQQAVQIFAASGKEELIGTDGQTLQKQRFTPDEVTSVIEELNHQGFWSREVEYITKQGKLFWGNLAVKQIYVAGEEIHLVRVTDISQRKLAEIALHERETMLRSIGDNLPNGAVYQIIRELDRSDRFSYFSAGIERLMEVKAEDVLADATLLYRQLCVEDIPSFVQAVEKSYHYLSVFDIQLRIYTPSGIWKWVQLRSTPRQLPDGRVAWDGLIVDVTDIKHTEDTLRQSEALLAESQRVARLGNWDYDLANKKITWSKGLFELFQRDPALAAPSYEENLQLHHPEDQQQLHQAVERAVSTGESYKLVLRAFKADGSMMYVEGIGHAQLNSLGKVIRLYGTAQDITSRKQAQEALTKSEEQLRLTLEYTHIGNWDWNLHTNEVIWNYNHYRLLGLEPETSTASYQAWRDVVHPDDINRVEQSVAHALKQHSNFELEYRVIRPDGTMRWLVGKGHGIYDETGNPVRMLGVIIDINDRKQTEQALREKEHFLSSIYDGVANSIFVVDVVDGDFRFIGLNPAHERLTGFRSHELQGKTPEQALPPIVAASVRQHYQDCVEAGETITYEEYLHLNNQDTWWITNLTPLRNENLNIYRIIGSSINITEQKRAQQMLELQAVITGNMAEGLCLVRADDGVIVYNNPKFAQIFGYEVNELIGQHISIINYEDEHTKPIEVHEAIAAAAMQYGETTYEVQNIKKDGTPFWCRATASVFAHPEYGTVFVAVQQDITEQKQTGEKIKASLKEKEVLLKEIHHRVKNNLGIVSSLLQMQCRRTQDPQATAILRDSQNRIASIALAHEKLYRSNDLANIDFAQYIPDLTTHLFDSYNVKSSCIHLSIQVEDTNLDLETAIPCGLIINELVSNALKYAFPDNREGEIQVRLCQESDRTLTLIVRDNGIGLPLEFDSKKNKTLGITLVQGLVKQLRGKLEIQSQSGTEFKISFTTSRV